MFSNLYSCTNAFIFVFTIIIILLCYRILKIVLINIKYKKVWYKFIQTRNKSINSFLYSYSTTVPQKIQDQILSYNCTEILKKLQMFEITSEQLLITYALRAATIGKSLNLIADVNFFEALEEAKSKDIIRRQAAKNNTILPPLFGLVMSVKDHVTCKGLQITAGYLHALSQNKSEVDCNFILVLKRAGVIFYVSSNIPQGLGSIECTNKLFGSAKNPWDLSRTTGGSSGGEAGLVSARCSPCGIGSDAAGSIRIPAAFCGVYGYSPSPHRISLKRTLNLRKHDLHFWREIGCAYGPIGRSVDDLKLITENILGQFEELDGDIAPLKWDQTKYESSLTRKLKIAYLLNDKFYEVLPGNRNVILEVVQFLKNEGHEVVEIDDNLSEKFMELGLPIMQPYGVASNIERTLESELPEKMYWLQVLASKLPAFILKIVGKCLMYAGEYRLGKMLSVLVPYSMLEFYVQIYKKELLKDWFHSTYKIQQHFDVFLSPVLGFPAPQHNVPEIISALIGGTFMFNMMYMPSGVVPIRKIHAAEENVQMFKRNTPKDLIAKKVEEIAKGSSGLPVGVQAILFKVSTFSYEDELCLAVMKIIQDKFKFYEFPPVACVHLFGTPESNNNGSVLSTESMSE